MSSFRFLSLVGFVVLSLSSVACFAPPADGEKESTGFAVPGKSNGSRTASGTEAEAAGGGTCDGACSHYIECKGLTDDAQTHATCVNECTSINASAADLATLEQADCATTIAMAEGANGGGTNGGASGGASNKGKECEGCNAWGSQCVWTSQSDWGQGPYSGAVIDCEAYCCQ